MHRAYGLLLRGCRLRRVLRVEKPDVVISFMGEANLLNAMLAQNPVVTVHNHLSSMSEMRPRLESFAADLLVRCLYRRATVVAVSEGVRRDLTTRYRLSGSRVVVIPNPVDAARVRELAAEPVVCPWDVRLPVIMTVGRLSREKGHGHLMRSFAEARKSVPCQLAIVGAGELERDLMRLSRDLGIGEHTYFLGWQPNPFKYIARSTVFVLPSLTEGFGLALVEAMACRVPVIATDCPGGSREIVAPEGSDAAGILVPVPNRVTDGAAPPPTSAERELASAIVTLIGDGGLRATYAARGERRAADFGYPAFASSYRKLIAHAARTRRGVSKSVVEGR